MHELPEQNQPPKDGEALTAAPDVISLPRRKIGIVQVTVGLIFLLALEFLGKAGWIVWQWSQIGMPLVEGAGEDFPFIIAHTTVSIISGVGFAIGGIGLAFFVGFGRKWTQITATLLPALYCLEIFGVVQSQADKAELWPHIISLIRVTGLAVLIWWLVQWIPPVRRYNVDSREEFPRRAAANLCVLAVLLQTLVIPDWNKLVERWGEFDLHYEMFDVYTPLIITITVPLICFLVGFMLFGLRRALNATLLIIFILIVHSIVHRSGSIFDVDWRWNHWMEFLLNNIVKYLPIALIIAAAVMFGFLRGQISVSIISALLCLCAILVHVEYIYNELAVRSYGPWRWNHVVWLIIRIPAILVAAYPLAVLAVLPFRPLGKELFRKQ